MRNTAQKILSNLLVFSLFSLPFVTGATESTAQGHHPGGKIFFGILIMVLILFVIAIGVVSTCLIISVLRPHFTIAGSVFCSKNHMRSLAGGVMCFIFYALLLQIIKNAPESFRLLAIPVGIVFMAHSVAGLTMGLHRLGEKVIFNTGSRFTASTFMAVLYGGILFIFAGLLPVLGLLIQAYILFLGLGSSLLILFPHRTQDL